MSKLDIVGLCGSLRAGSLNRSALKLAGNSMPESMQLEICEWRAIPLFDADEMAKGFPETVTTLRDRLKRADGVVIATPEYNFTLPGAFKNAIDWLSRCDPQPFANKPVAILSASGGPLGGARVQYDVRRMMMFLSGMPLIKPEVFIGSAAGKFDAAGECTDEQTKKFVRDQMTAFEKWIGAVKRMTA
jgi:chromate reductase